MKNIDNFLIDRVFQPIQDWFQIKFNKNCYHLASQCFMLVALTCILLACSQFYSDNNSGSIVFLSILWCIGSICQIHLAKTMSKLAEMDFSNSGTMSTMRLSNYWLRMWFLIMFVIFEPTDIFKLFQVEMFSQSWFMAFFFVFFNLSILFGEYFAACTPKPPSWVDEKQKENIPMRRMVSNFS